MTPLLAITAVLLVGSGLLKLRAADRLKLGIHLLSILELLVGLGIGVSLMAGGLTVAVGFRTLLGALTLVLASSVSLGVKLRVVRRRRNLSEGGLLQNRNVCQSCVAPSKLVRSLPHWPFLRSMSSTKRDLCS
jgi:hypothetical protein